MKLKLKQLQSAIELLKWKGGSDSYQHWEKALVEIHNAEESIDNGQLMGTLCVSISYDAVGYDKIEKTVKKTIEMYDESENKDPVMTVTESFKITKD